MGALNDFFLQDHRRLLALLEQAAQAPGGIDQARYAEFREGLLRHIAMEERVLLPAVVEAKGGRPLLTARRLRVEHSAIASMLVPPPGKGVIATLRRVLDQHHRLEEGPGGVYDACEELLGDKAGTVLEKARAFPLVPVLPHNAAPVAYESACRALDRAGFDVAEEELRS